MTDVSDPLFERADRDGEDWWRLAARETDLYRRDMEALRVLPPAHLVGAVEALPLIERFNQRLADRGALYCLDRDVYFARSADSSFGKLSGPSSPSGFSLVSMAGLFAERGGDPIRAGKKDPLDPLVWRGKRPGEPTWESRFGPGRPGWHVECAAIATEFLGMEFDVQAGGPDLVFPHHEMCGSHVRVAFGDHAFARVYAHTGPVRYEGAKMSKSLGNLVFVRRVMEVDSDPMAIRLAILAHHYRSGWDWTDSVLAEAKARLARWRSALAAAAATADPLAVGSVGAVLAAVRERLAEDLDAPGALAAIDWWADEVVAGSTSAAADADLVVAAADALLGVVL